MNNWGVLIIDLVNEIKLFICSDFVETSRFSIENESSKKEINEIWVFKYSISIILPLFLRVGPTVFKLSFNLKGFRTILISLNSISKFLFISLIFFSIWVLNLLVSMP